MPTALSGFSFSRLKWPRPYPVVFLGVVFCLAGRMGDFMLTGRDMGESWIFETMGSLAFSFGPLRGPLLVADRLRFRADSGRFTLAEMRITFTGLTAFLPLTRSRLWTGLSYPPGVRRSVFCPVVISGGFWLTGRIMGELRACDEIVFPGFCSGCYGELTRHGQIGEKGSFWALMTM